MTFEFVELIEAALLVKLFEGDLTGDLAGDLIGEVDLGVL